MKFLFTIFNMLVDITCAYTRHYYQVIGLLQFAYNHTMSKRHSAIKKTAVTTIDILLIFGVSDHKTTTHAFINPLRLLGEIRIFAPDFPTIKLLHVIMFHIVLVLQFAFI